MRISTSITVLVTVLALEGPAMGERIWIKDRTTLAAFGWIP